MKMDFEDEDKYDIMAHMAREAAKQMFATSMFLKDKRDPRITITQFDGENGTVVIDMNEEFTSEGNDDEAR